MLAARSARCRKKVAKKLQSCTAQRHVAHRHCPRLGLTTAAPTLAALRPAHDHARAEHARHARCTRVSLASDPRAPTLQHALARQKQGWRARVTGHWLTVGRPAACASGSRTRCNALATSAARAAHASLTRCACHAPSPLSRVQRDEDNERDEDERHDEEDQGHDGRRERVRATRACSAHAQRRTRKHAAREHEPGPRHSTCCSSDRHCARHTTR